MEIFSVTDQTIGALIDSNFDIAVFAAGYEERCTNIATLIRGSQRIAHICVFGFDDHTQSEQRRINSVTLGSLLEVDETMATAHEDGQVLERFQAVWQEMAQQKRRLRILIDYSSMSKFWYGGIFHFLKSQRRENDIEVIFAYSVGEHQDYQLDVDPDISNVIVQQIVYLPGFEGASLRLDTIAIFGLGFDWAPPIAVLERIEPDIVYAFTADPGSFPDYNKIALQKNQQFIGDYVKERLFAFPLRSVDTTFRRVGEIFLPFSNKSNIILIPLGPKPHVLACMLLASKFEPVALLHAMVRRRRPERVRVSDPTDVVVTEVMLTADSQT